MFIAVDLDGTLCDGTHKADLLQLPKRKNGRWPEQDWKAWVNACLDDVLIGPTGEFIKSMDCMGHTIEFWTGRGEHAREVTEQWLGEHGFGDMPVRMRPMETGDDPDHVVKRRFLDKYGRPDLILEDRVSVVRMWRDEGITCWQVAEGNY